MVMSVYGEVQNDHLMMLMITCGSFRRHVRTNGNETLRGATIMSGSATVVNDGARNIYLH